MAKSYGFTEADWLVGTDWGSMLNHIGGQGHNRKSLLLAVALCRRIWDQLPFDDCRQIVEAVERLADHPQVDGDDHSIVVEVDALFTELQEGYHRVHEAEMNVRGPYLAALSCGAMWHDPDGTIESAADAAAISVASVTEGPTWEAEQQAQARLLHELFGNPFRPVTFKPEWRTETTLSLATTIYAERAFDRMPILADALEEAGCDHADVLNHCRDAGPHVRGCWMVDLLLGKS